MAAVRDQHGRMVGGVSADRVEEEPLGAAGRDDEELGRRTRVGVLPVEVDHCATEVVEQATHRRRQRLDRLLIVQRRRDDRVDEAGLGHVSCSIRARSTCSGWAPTTVSTRAPSRMNNSIGMLRAS